MKDIDGDGRADIFETVASPWAQTGDYHEYAFGSKFDQAWLHLGRALPHRFVHERRALSRLVFSGISADGKAIPTCSGIRSPGGIATNAVGDMFYTDNQGPWNGACALKHLEARPFHGESERQHLV